MASNIKKKCAVITGAIAGISIVLKLLGVPGPIVDAVVAIGGQVGLTCEAIQEE